MESATDEEQRAPRDGTEHHGRERDDGERGRESDGQAGGESGEESGGWGGDDNHRTPEGAFENTLEEGRRRLGRSNSALIATGLVGGIDVATGVLAMLLVKQATGSEMWAGLAFSIGFVALTLARSELFTENFLVPVITVVARQCRVSRLVRLWLGTTVFNLLGGWVATYFIVSGYPPLRHTAIDAGKAYIHYGLGWRAFSLAILGGLVITLMTWMQHTTDNMGAKLLSAVVAAFLLGAGKLNHAIVASLAMFAALHTGAAPFGYLDWVESAAWAALGNMVGGIGLVTVFRIMQAPQRLVTNRENPAPHVAQAP